MAKSRKPAKGTSDSVEDAVEVVDPVADDASDKTEVVTEPSEDPLVLEGSDRQDAEVDADNVAEDKPDVVEATPARGTGASFSAMLLGGAVAATLGFGAARYPDQWPFVSQPAEDPIEAAVATLDGRLDDLEAGAKSQEAALATLQGDTGLDQLRGETRGELDQIRGQLDALSTKIDELENRIHTVEKLPQGSGMEAAAAAATAYERELQQMRQMLDAELERITAAQEDAQTLEVSAAETARAAAARAAMSRVLAAIETGRPFDDALFDLTENADAEIPAMLSEYADRGIATLSALQDEFPEAARKALDSSIRAAVSDGQMDRVTAFFRTQLGTRSLEPKEGDDPDAVLSRAEAALKEGRIGTALSELAAMPDAGKPALEAWVAKARARHDALEAAQSLAQHVNSN